MKVTEYFAATRRRPDRAQIKSGWIWRACRFPEYQQVQSDGRIRRWARIKEAEGRWLRVILLADGETVHNAFFDRRFRP